MKPMRIKFGPDTPKSKRAAIRKALAAAHTPAANRARIAGIKAAALRRKEAKLRGEIPQNQQVVPLDAIPGEQRPVIRYLDSLSPPAPRKNGVISRDQDEREKRQLAMALVATVHALTK